MIASIILKLSVCFLTIVNGFIMDKSGNYAALRGSDVTLPCVPKNIGEDRCKQETTCVWIDKEGQELNNARYTKTENGDLQVRNVDDEDNGLYKCKLDLPGDKTFEHQLVVYDLAGHRFVSTLYFDLELTTVAQVVDLLNDLLLKVVCAENLCSAGNIDKLQCKNTEAEKHSCQFAIDYQGVHMAGSEQCDEDCLRQRMIESLEQGERILKTQLSRLAENSRIPFEPDLSTFETKHTITCRAGYHLVKPHLKRCFPCLPGSYSSEPDSITCSLCAVGHFQDNYGKEECHACDDGKTTEAMGAKSMAECIDNILEY